MSATGRVMDQRPSSNQRLYRATWTRKFDMKLLNLFKAFHKDESGAVTVDWVVLTAAIVGLGMVVMVSVGGGITGLGDSIVTDLNSRQSGYANQ